MTIEELDYYCWLHDRAIIIHKGRFVGFIKGYRVGRFEDK